MVCRAGYTVDGEEEVQPEDGDQHQRGPHRLPITLPSILSPRDLLLFFSKFSPDFLPMADVWAPRNPTPRGTCPPSSPVLHSIQMGVAAELLQQDEHYEGDEETVHTQGHQARSVVDPLDEGEHRRRNPAALVVEQLPQDAVDGRQEGWNA